MQDLLGIGIAASGTGGVPWSAALCLQVDGRFLAALCLNLVADLLAFVEAIETSALDGANMDEHVLAAAIGLNETETFGGVAPP